MKKIFDEDKILIESQLYTEVMLIIESLYDIECNIDKDKKDSTKIIFRDKKAAIKGVAQAIERFSQERNIDKNDVKNHLISIIEEKTKLKSIFIEEYEEAIGIIAKEDDTAER